VNDILRFLDGLSWFLLVACSAWSGATFAAWVSYERGLGGLKVADILLRGRTRRYPWALRFVPAVFAAIWLWSRTG
jgi:hypothetical protein